MDQGREQALVKKAEIRIFTGKKAENPHFIAFLRPFAGLKKRKKRKILIPENRKDEGVTRVMRNLPGTYG